MASPVNRSSFRRKHLPKLLGEKEGHPQDEDAESANDGSKWRLRRD